jgi:hypothetical protein
VSSLASHSKASWVVNRNCKKRTIPVIVVDHVDEEPIEWA